MEVYWKLLEEERRKNEKLGYGNDKINWERRNYERQLRNLKQEEKIKNAENGKGLKAKQ